MKDQRCPWCGKKLPNKVNIWKRIKTGLKPVHQCPYCFNPMSSPLSTALYTPILLIIIGLYLNVNALIFTIYCLCAVSAFVVCILLIAFGKYNYYKMGSDGKRLNSYQKKYRGCVNADIKPRLHKKQLLLTDKDFENSEALSVSSPIRITKYSSKNQHIEYVFLYDHKQNEELVENGAFSAYLSYDNEIIALTIQDPKEV
ncbi:MAG: hypothetical protein IKJ07_05100 [Clostridia bacterium]|nr:hypothetical protein [Clostridia bacterium]